MGGRSPGRRRCRRFAVMSVMRLPDSAFPRLRFAGRGALGCGLAMALSGAFPGIAYADGTPPPAGVMEKPRPDYDAKGIPLGSDWLLLPSFAATANYDDNVFRVSRETSSDWYFQTTPAVRLQRKFESGSIGLFGNTDTLNYLRFGRLNLTDWTLGADGRLAVSKALNLAAVGYYGEYHEDFSSADVIGKQLTMTRYFRGHLDGAADYQAGEWHVRAGLLLDRFDWQPTTLVSGAHVDNADRNETLYGPNAKLAYDAGRGYQLFVKAFYDGRNFDRAVDRFGFERSSSGYHVDGGATLTVSQTLSGEIFAGWLQQNFAQHVSKPLPDVSELDYGAELHWYAAPTFTVHFTATRSLDDIILPGVSVADDQSARLAADWEVRHDIIVQGFAAYTDSRLIGVPRTDRYPSGGVTLRYLVNRYASAELAWLHTGRSSTVQGVDFADNIVTAGLNLHI